MIYLNHIPKCGGTAFSSLIEERFRLDEILSAPRLIATNMLSNTERNAVLYLPDAIMAETGLITGHIGEGLRGRLPDVYSVVLLREPIARFRSMFRHHLRDRNAFSNLSTVVGTDGELIDASVGLLRALRPLSMLSFLTPQWSHFEDSATSMHEHMGSALAALETYDIVVTEETFDFFADFLRLVLGAAPDRVRIRLNEGGNTSEPGFSSEVESAIRAELPEEFVLYQRAVERSRQIKSRVEADVHHALHEARGRIARKQSHWRLDWREPQLCGGWSERRSVAIPELSRLWGRIMLGGTAFVEAPLASGRHSIRMTTWFSEPFEPSRLRVHCNGTPVNTIAEFPEPQNESLVILKGDCRVADRPSWSRLTFEYDRRESLRNEAWLIEMVVRK